MSKNTPFLFFFVLFITVACLEAPCFSVKPSPPRHAQLIYKLCDSIVLVKITDSLNIAQWCDTSGDHGIMGYRFHIKGDFNGDGLEETLSEYFTDSMGREIPKYYGTDEISTNRCFEETCKRKNFLWSKSLPKDSIMCEHLAFAENLGDLNGDGTDEIGCINEWGDYSSISHYSIFTFKKHHWIELLNIPTWEWMFPSTPVNPSMYYMFGHLKDTLIVNDTLNQRLEKELNDFDYVKKRGNGIIEFMQRHDGPYDENDLYVPADAIPMRYNLYTGKYKMQLPEHISNQNMLDSFEIAYKKINQNEFLINGKIYYAK